MALFFIEIYEFSSEQYQRLLKKKDKKNASRASLEHPVENPANVSTFPGRSNPKQYTSGLFSADKI